MKLPIVFFQLTYSDGFFTFSNSSNCTNIRLLLCKYTAVHKLSVYTCIIVHIPK